MLGNSYGQWPYHIGSAQGLLEPYLRLGSEYPVPHGERRQEDDNENDYHWEDAVAPGLLKEATALLEMFEEEDGRVPKRGKTRHWIKQKEEKGYFTNIVSVEFQFII